MSLMLQGKEDEIFEFIADGFSISMVANKLGCSKGAVRSILEAHPARANAAFTTAADSAADKAELVLLDENMEIMRARELASHYRWQAKMFNKQKYGDKVDITSDNQPLNPVNNEVLSALAAKINA